MCSGAKYKKPPVRLKYEAENPLAVQWLGLHSFTAKQCASVPGWGTKIPQAMQHSQNEHTHTHHKNILKNKYLNF